MKKELVEYLSLESMMFGLTTNNIKNLAFQLAEKNNLPNSFNKAKKKAGKDWLQGFMHRYKELSLRQQKLLPLLELSLSIPKQSINFLSYLKQ